MPRFVSLSLCLALLLPATLPAHYMHGVGDALVLIEAPGEDGPALQSAGLFLLVELPDGYLAFVDPHEFDGLRATGHSFEVLVESDDKTLEYLIAWKHDEAGHDHGETHPSIHTLYNGEHYRIQSVPADLLEEQPNCVPDLQRVYRRPLSFVRRPWTDDTADREVVVDPALADALTEITQTPLQEQVQTLQDFVTRHSQYSGGLQASYWIRDKFLAYGYTDVSLHNYNSWNDNVVCVKPGAVYPDEVVVIGAHYDTINYSGNSYAPGADDNATGSVAVLEAARVLFDIEFERTIIFICFSGEEEGLVGSDAWAGDAASAGMDIVGMLNLDMICYRAAGDSEDLDIIDNSASAPMSEFAFDVVAAYVPELATVEGYLTSGTSDHAAFWSHGYRAIFFFEDSGSYTPYLHSSNDVIGASANDFPFMLKNVKAATAFIGAFARPFHVSIAHSPVGNSEGTGPFETLAEIHSVEPLDQADLHYRVNGGAFNTLSLTPTGVPDEYSATIPPISPHSQVEYYLTASDVDGYQASNPDNAPGELHSFRTGVSFVFVEDGEIDQGWQLGVAGDNATTGHWIRADPVGTSYQPEDDHSPDPGTICFVTGNANPGDSPGTNDVDNGHTTLLSPVFDLSEASWAGLSYWRWYTDETSHDDDFFVDISNNGGTTWQVLEIVDDSAYPWVKAEFDDLASIIPLTSEMRLRFIAEDTGSGSLVEALIDDLEVVAFSNDATPAEDTPVFAASLSAHPNPFNPKTTLHFTLPRRGMVDLTVFDAKGAEVSRLVSGELNSGSHEALFNGQGKASGIYFARLRLDGREMATTKITLLK
ncbi:MAG: M20/M25/M40 family metallo-hydrolase [Candidatus Krumholzibacteria bacterium]|nr:M20/M25/M40 family metallo-hydrolase [Candidatus Krumholzibacteria bacterium]